MKIEPYVLLSIKSPQFSDGEKPVLVVPVRNLELNFFAYPDGDKIWGVVNKDSFYEGFCSLDAKDFKAASEITADSPEEYVLKLAAMGFVYGGDDDES